MGACTSVPNDSDSSMRYRLGLASKTKKFFFLASPVKEKSLNEANLVDGLEISELGSKEEIFFDTQVWLDSDCEDDFFSVNGGDFTPSRGSTPIHPLSMPSDEPSPTGRKKLAELLYETSQDKQLDSVNLTEEKDATGTSNSLSTSSACSTEATPSRDLSKDKEWRVGHCCLPSLRNFGFDEKREKMSPCAVIPPSPSFKASS